MNNIPRLRMFAGPNGSGKTTIKSVISQEMVGIYINPDEIETYVHEFKFLNFSTYEIVTDFKEILDFFTTSPLLIKENLVNETKKLQWVDNKLIFDKVKIDSYFASVMADFIRKKLIGINKSFTFETVMSFHDKVYLLHDAQKKGYRTYLYYIATDDPEINISRVNYRVNIGGHAVTKNKILERYKRSIGLLKEAIKYTNRAYIFDNSNHEYIWLAEITDGKILEIKTTYLPAWFKKVIGDSHFT